MSLADQSQQWYPTSVQVTVLQARGLRTKGKNGTNDAYAIMQVAKEKYSTSVAEKTVAPMWKEEATFDLPLSQQQQHGGSTLHVHIMHRALVGPDKLLGQAVINLLELSEDKSRNKTEWCKLLNKAGKSDKDRGEVLLDIQFMRNNMTASMFDLSGMDKPRSRLGKLKDKVRGKKKDQLSETASAIVPSSFTQVLTDSEEEGARGGEGEGGADSKEQKKRHKLKSLFSPKSNLQRNVSQSMSVLGPLPERSSSLSGSRSSGLNIDSSEGKKKFKFIKTHKRSGSSDSKTSQGSQQSNLCINVSHVYNEGPQPRRSRGGSNFSLASSGLGSMEDLHRAESSNTSVASADSFRVLKQQSRWAEVENSNRAGNEEEPIEEEQHANSGTEVEEEEKRMGVCDEKEKRRISEIEENDTIQEQWEEGRLEEERVEEEQKRMEEEEGQESLRMEEERKVRQEKMVREEEEERERIAEERRRIEEEETIRMEEERKQREEGEKRAREEEEERERLAEERRRIEEVEMIRMKEERKQREEEKRVREEEEERERIAEERRRIEEEETIRMEEERKRREEEEKRVREEEGERERIAEERRIEEEETIRKAELERLRIEEERKSREEEENRVREERERVEKERLRAEEEQSVRKAELERLRIEEERKRREEQERLWKEEEERERLAEERKRQEEQEMRMVEEERAKVERKQREEKEESVRKEKEEIERISEEKRVVEKEKEMSEEEARFRKQEQESIRMEEERAEEERKRREGEEEEERFRKEEEEMEREVEEERRQEERERLRKEEEVQIRREEEERADRMKMEGEDKKNDAEESRFRMGESEREIIQEVKKIKEEESEREEETLRRDMEMKTLDEEACLMQENRLNREEEGRMLTVEKEMLGETSGPILAKDIEQSQWFEGESSGGNQMREGQEAKGLREDQSRNEQMDRKERGEKGRIRITDELHLDQNYEVAVESDAPSEDLASTDPFVDISSSNPFDETSSMAAGPHSKTSKVFAVKPSSSSCLNPPQHFLPSNPFLQPFESETEPSQQMATCALEKKRRAPLPPNKQKLPLEPAVSSTLDLAETKPSGLQPTSTAYSATHLVGNNVKESISADGKDKGPAPQPPGKKDAQKPLRREQDVNTVCQMAVERTNKIKTSNMFPKRLVQMIAPVSRPTSTTMDVQEGTSQNSIHNFKQPGHIASIPGGSTVATHNKGPAPCRPQSSSEAFAEPKRALSSADANPTGTSKSYKHGPVTDQVPVVFRSNPFEEGETEIPLKRPDEITTSWNLENIDSYSHQNSPSADQDTIRNTKKKSSKTEHAPLPPANKTPISSNQLVMNQGTESVSNRHDGVTGVPDNTVILPRAALSSSSHPKPLEISDTRGDDRSHIVALSATSDPITQVVVTKGTGEQAGGKWDVPASASRRPHPVKPMSPQEHQPVSVRQGTKDKKSTANLCEVEERIKMKEEPRSLTGPYSQLTQEELISLVVKQQSQLSERDNKINQLEKYIDALLVRVMEEQPSILMSMSTSSTA